VEGRLRAGRAGLGGQRIDLRPRRAVRGLGLVQRRLADVVPGQQLALARQLPRRDVELRARRRDLRAAGTGALLGRAGVDAQQHLAGAHAVAGLHVQRGHHARHLRGDDGLAHRLHPALVGGAGGGGGRPHRHRRQIGRPQRREPPEEQQRGQGPPARAGCRAGLAFRVHEHIIAQSRKYAIAQ